MIGIDWLFIGGAGGIVGIALIEKLADDFGYRWFGAIVRIAFPIVTLGASLTMLGILAEVFLK